MSAMKPSSGSEMNKPGTGRTRQTIPKTFCTVLLVGDETIKWFGNGQNPLLAELVKFKSYKTKAMVYKAKSSLKDNDYGIFMTEDLTKRNHGIIKDLLLLKKSEQIHSFWTMDGKIYVKLEDSSKPKQIRI